MTWWRMTRVDWVPIMGSVLGWLVPTDGTLRGKCTGFAWRVITASPGGGSRAAVRRRVFSPGALFHNHGLPAADKRAWEDGAAGMYSSARLRRM